MDLGVRHERSSKAVIRTKILHVHGSDSVRIGEKKKLKGKGYTLDLSARALRPKSGSKHSGVHDQRPIQLNHPHSLGSVSCLLCFVCRSDAPLVPWYPGRATQL